MWTDPHDVLVELLATKLPTAQIGVVVRGIHGVDAAQVASAVAARLNQHLYVAAVGTPVQSSAGHLTLVNQIEAAVGWRNEPDKAGRILVFVAGDVEKLASLSFLDLLEPQTLARYWLERAAQELAVNTPQQQFWQALATEANLYPLQMLRDFIQAVAAQGAESLDAIPNNLWRLGLINDPHILDSNQAPAARLERNRDRVTEAGQLSENSRRRMSTVVGNARKAGRNDLVATFHYLLDYYRLGTLDSLSRLELDQVETLITEGRALTLDPPAVPAPPVPNTTTLAEEEADYEVSDPAPTPVDRRLTGRRLQTTLAEQLVQGHNADGLYELGQRLQQAMDRADQSQKDLQAGDLPGFATQTVAFDNLPRDLYRFIGACCAADIWGATVVAEQHDLREVVKAATPDQLVPYNPEQPDVDRLSLFETLRQFDQYLPDGPQFTAILDRLATARRRLLPYLSLLLVRPEVFLGGYPEGVADLNEYLDATADLYHLFRTHAPALYNVAHQSVQFVEAELLRLEVIHVQAGGEWKALLTPLHPFHLWRYREIMALLERERVTLGPTEQAQLAEVLPDLPHLLHFVVASTHIVGNQQVILPHAGNIDLLPTYENHTNRYLGNDGLEVLEQLLARWLDLTPYAKYQIRLALVDVPDLIAALDQVSEFLTRTAPHTQMVVDAYYTPERVFTDELAGIDYDQHEPLREMLLSGRLEISVARRDTLERVCKDLQSRPVHIAFLFDQSQFDITAAPRVSQLLVSPLVVTYSYDYDKVRRQGSISPSSEAESGLFADYHYVVEHAGSLPGGQQLRLKTQGGPRSALSNTIIRDQGTIWLAVADRSLISYAPEAAVPLLERLAGQREVGLWASNYSQTMRGLLDLLTRYNLKPDWTQVVHLVHTYGHIAATGLFAVTAARSQPEKRSTQQKGLLGTILAAEWYRRKFPGALVASLDSTLARQWLARRTDSQSRADLIGLRMVDNQAVLEIIEVKSRADAGEVQATRNRRTGETTLAGPALAQLNQTLSVVGTIFGREDNSPLFTPARREALRYQLYRECFRENHDREDQERWFEVLNRVFHQPPEVLVECRGRVVQVIFEENIVEETVQDSGAPLSWTRIGALLIQHLISTDMIVSPAPQAGSPPFPPTQLPGEPGTPLTALEQDVPPVPAATVPAITPLEQAFPVITPVNEDHSYHVPHGPMSVPEVRRTPSLDERPEAQVDMTELKTLAQAFRRACEDFRITIAECDPNRAVVGPSVIRFYVRLARGQSLSQLQARLIDISRGVKRSGLLMSLIPNDDLVALDIPRLRRVPVPFREGLARLPAIASPEEMPLTIGVTPEGEHIVRDLSKMPHLLVGGTTGAGKTMFLYTLLCSLLARHPEAATLRLLISTSKAEDFTFFAGLPHLETGRVIDEAENAVELIRTLVHAEFEQRKAQLEAAHCRDIVEYNRKHTEQLAPIVVMVDEFADLADQLAGDKRERDAFYTIIKRIAQLGRSRGVYLVLCTQRPSADLVPTYIRNLMNARVALRVNDATASRMILEDTGAEQLQRHGDLLFKEESQVLRAQGYFIDTEAGELTQLLTTLLH